MESGRQVVEIERYPVRLVGDRSSLDLTRPLGDQADQREFAGIAQTVERGAVQPLDRDAGGARLPQNGAGARVAILDIPDRVVP